MRFPGFEGEWERKQLSVCCEIYDGTHQTPKYTKTGIPFVSVEDITALRTIEKKFISEDDYKRDFKIAPQAGDILMTRIGDIGTSRVVTDNSPLAYYVSLALLRPIGIEASFLNSYIPSPYFKRELYRRTIHVAFPQKINKEDIGKCLFAHPSIVEQSKIGSFLSLLDQRIDTQSKLIDRYESLIRALYHEILCNAPGTIITLGDLVQIKKGTQLNGENLLTVGKYYVMNGGITPSGYYDSYNTPREIISISEGGNSCGYVQYNSLPFWSGGHCYTLLPQTQNKDLVKYRYLYHYLKYHQDDIMAMRIGSGLPNIQKKDLERFQVILPETQIQERYTVLFDAVDSVISIEKALLNKLIESKKHLISQMFI